MKASKAKVAQRVEEFVRIILDGAEPFDLRPYVSDQEAKPGSPWELAEGEKPLSDRQIRRYAAAAEKVIAESCRTSRKRLMRRHLARRRNLYAKALSAGDIRTALAVLADEAALLALYPPKTGKVEVSGPGGGPIRVGYDLSKLSDADLEHLDALLDRADPSAPVADGGQGGAMP